MSKRKVAAITPRAVERAASIGSVASLLADLEEALPWDAVRKAWGYKQKTWRRQLEAATTAQGEAALSTLIGLARQLWKSIKEESFADWYQLGSPAWECQIERATTLDAMTDAVMCLVAGTAGGADAGSLVAMFAQSRVKESDARAWLEAAIEASPHTRGKARTTVKVEAPHSAEAVPPSTALVAVKAEPGLELASAMEEEDALEPTVGGGFAACAQAASVTALETRVKIEPELRARADEPATPPLRRHSAAGSSAAHAAESAGAEGGPLALLGSADGAQPGRTRSQPRRAAGASASAAARKTSREEQESDDDVDDDDDDPDAQVDESSEGGESDAALDGEESDWSAEEEPAADGPWALVARGASAARVAGGAPAGGMDPARKPTQPAAVLSASWLQDDADDDADEGGAANGAGAQVASLDAGDSHALATSREAAEAEEQKSLKEKMTLSEVARLKVRARARARSEIDPRLIRAHCPS